jgi:hypothetical protein
MFPCFRAGRSSCFVFRSSSERIRIERVSEGSITSSMKHLAAARKGLLKPRLRIAAGPAANPL